MSASDSDQTDSLNWHGIDCFDRYDIDGSHGAGLVSLILLMQPVSVE